jgi:hypothetical protein
MYKRKYGSVIPLGFPSARRFYVFCLVELYQSLHFDGRPATSDFTSTPDLSLHRANRRDVPNPEVAALCG